MLGMLGQRAETAETAQHAVLRISKGGASRLALRPVQRKKALVGFLRAKAAFWSSCT